MNLKVYVYQNKDNGSDYKSEPAERNGLFVAVAELNSLGVNFNGGSKLPLPYYSDKKDKHTSRTLYLLSFMDVKKVIDHITKKDIGYMHPDQLQNIVAAYHKLEDINLKKEENLRIWVMTIEIYFEIIKIVTELGKYDEMHQIYRSTICYLTEGQQDLIYINKQLEQFNPKSIKEFISRKGNDCQPEFKILMDKYQSLYEKNVRYSITLAIYCLDQINNHPDIKRKKIDEYVTDDLSYKLDKIEECKHIKFINKLDFLSKGIEPHIRNSIAHQTFEYGEHYDTKFIDEDKRRKKYWEKTYKIGEFKSLIDELEINFHAQFVAISLFIIEYFEKLDFSKIKGYTNLKQLRMLIDSNIQDSFFVPLDIKFNKNESKIVCDVEKIGGFDFESTRYINIGGIITKRTRPALNPRNQSLKLAYDILSLKADFEKCEVKVYDYNHSVVGSIIINLKLAENVIKQEGNTKQSFEKSIIFDNYKDNT